jgi:hypothetical protein
MFVRYLTQAHKYKFKNKNALLATRGHKQCWHFARGIIPQLGKASCTKMPFRIASRTAHTAKRLAIMRDQTSKT